jgi:acetylornithine deacetylase
MASDVIDLTRQLVSIESVNPTLAPGDAGEGEIARFVTTWAEGNGLTAETIPTADGRPNVIVRGRRTADGPTLMLCGHLDTVGLGAMERPLEPRIDGDRLIGRGAYDMKGALAATLVACRDATRAGVNGQVIVAAVADEEHASLGIQAVLEHVTADAVIVTEPTELAIGISHRGFVWVEIEVIGRAAHGSRPHLGVDAIFRTGPVIAALEAYNVRLQGQRHPLLGPALLHASLIAGGSEMATLPDHVLLSVERRTIPGETQAMVEAEIEAVLRACRAADPALRAVARVTLARDPFEIDASHPFVGVVRDAAASVLGAPPAVDGLSFWADSAFTAAAGIPTVLFGPAGEGAHADDEWVSVGSLVTCAQVLTAAARAFCRRAR